MDVQFGAKGKRKKKCIGAMRKRNNKNFKHLFIIDTFPRRFDSHSAFLNTAQQPSFQNCGKHIFRAVTTLNSLVWSAEQSGTWHPWPDQNKNGRIKAKSAGSKQDCPKCCHPANLCVGYTALFPKL